MSQRAPDRFTPNLLIPLQMGHNQALKPPGATATKPLVPNLPHSQGLRTDECTTWPTNWDAFGIYFNRASGRTLGGGRVPLVPALSAVYVFAPNDPPGIITLSLLISYTYRLPPDGESYILRLRFLSLGCYTEALQSHSLHPLERSGSTFG